MTQRGISEGAVDHAAAILDRYSDIKGRFDKGAIRRIAREVLEAGDQATEQTPEAEWPWFRLDGHPSQAVADPGSYTGINDRTTHAYLRHVDGSWELLATDSFMLVCLPITIEVPEGAEQLDTTSLIPVPRQVLQAAEEAGGLAVGATQFQPVDWAGRGTGIYYRRVDLDWKAPDFDRMFDLATGDRIAIGFDVGYLQRIVESITGGKMHNGVALEVDTSNPTAAIRIRHNSPTGARALLMPIKLEDRVVA